MLEKTVLITYSTPNYSPVYDKHYDSVKDAGFSRIFHKLDKTPSRIKDAQTNASLSLITPSVNKNETSLNFHMDGSRAKILSDRCNSDDGSYQTDFWYYCIENKVKHLLDIIFLLLTEYAENPTNEKNAEKYVIFADCDVVLVKSNYEKWNLLEKYIENSNYPIFFRKEYLVENVNTGFYIMKRENLAEIREFFVEVYKVLVKSPKSEIPQGDQTIINNLLYGCKRHADCVAHIAHDYIPNEFSIWGPYIWNAEYSLFHHATCCKTVDEKVVQIENIRNFFV